MIQSIIRIICLAAFLFVFSGLTTAQAITINPTYLNGAGQTWSTVQKGVIQQAINDWQAALPDTHTVNVTFDFTNAGTGSYLGQWQGDYSLYEGTDVYPWTSGVTHNVHFNADLFSGSNYTWWDPTPATASDQPFAAWDALSVARHEIGHMMGFTDGFYVDNFYTAQEFDKWGIHISGTTFDPGGLNVSMHSSSNLGHVSNSGTTAGDLMVTALVNGTRRGISATDLNMLHLAYNYTIVTPPTSTTYTLKAIAGKTLMHAGDTSAITATITNTGTGTADTLDFTGLTANASGGNLSGSSTSGGPLAKTTGTASNSGLSFTSATAGTFTITPTAATATNHTLGTAASLSTTTPVTVTVYTGKGVWNSTTSGNWTNAAKWTAAGGVPGMDGALSENDYAWFQQTLASPLTVNLNGAKPRLADLYLDSIGSSFTLAPGVGGTLTMHAPVGSRAEILGIRGTNTISAPVILGGETVIACNSGVTLNFPGGISGDYTLSVASSITVSSIHVDTLQIGWGYYGSAATATVPEPSMLALVGMGLVGLLAYFRRWRKA